MYTKRFIGFFILLVGCIALAGGTPQEQRTTGAAEAQKSPVELRQQLIATAEEGRRMAEQMYRAGQGTTDQMLAWTQRWVEARLAAATNHQERLEALKDGLKLAQDREKDVQMRQQAGLVTPTDLVAAKYMRIQAELALANEK
jgi:outer membrane protein TolC